MKPKPLRAETGLGWALGVVRTEGCLDGVVGADGEDPSPVSPLLVAVTITVYSAPFVRPVIKQLVAPVVVHVAPPGEAAAV